MLFTAQYTPKTSVKPPAHDKSGDHRAFVSRKGKEKKIMRRYHLLVATVDPALVEGTELDRGRASIGPARGADTCVAASL